MPIIRPYSIVYLIISGEYKGKTCVLRSSQNKKSINIFLTDSNDPNPLIVKKGELVQLEMPGWPEERRFGPYELKNFTTKDGSGINMLRDSFHSIAQPSALLPNDILATGETVTEIPRSGFNSSALIHLDRTGWVEVAPRLPIALQGNKKFKLPLELVKNDKLITGDLVVEKPSSSEVGWVDISLDRKDCRIDTPACIPLALE